MDARREGEEVDEDSMREIGKVGLERSICVFKL